MTGEQLRKGGKVATELGKGFGIEMINSEKGVWMVYPEDLLKKITL